MEYQDRKAMAKMNTGWIDENTIEVGGQSHEDFWEYIF